MSEVVKEHGYQEEENIKEYDVEDFLKQHEAGKVGGEEKA